MEDKENMEPEDQEVKTEDQENVQQEAELTRKGQVEDTTDGETSEEKEDTASDQDQSVSDKENVEEMERQEPGPIAEVGADIEEASTEDISVEDEVTSEKDSDSEGHDDYDHLDEERKLLKSLNLDDSTKEELYQELKKFSSVENMRVVDKALKEIRPHYDKLYHKEEKDALKTFKGEENDEADFFYKGDETDQQFFFLYNKLRDKKQTFFLQMNKAKDDNLSKKNDLLERLRELVDEEESTTSLGVLKELQAEWKRIGPVPGQHTKSLWANYNALLDRFYDNRSIYFELKELDRKKNLEAKLELCERAEELDNYENIKDAIFQLNELHEEFKHIGPVPKEEQDPLWQRFKGASDKIYARRKEYFEVLKKELHENMKKKLALGDEAEMLSHFNSDRITEWNKRTKEILELQKKWDAIGGLPRERAKKVNKHFWGSFKKFFSNKNDFFKSLEGQREDNLKKKQELLERAEAIKDSEDWNKTANELKQLQSQWKEIGPVPEKFRNEVYRQFKAACDHFFELKRSKGLEYNKKYGENLRKKEEICSILEAYLNSDIIDLEQVYDQMDRYAEIGFVPRHAIKKIHDRYDKVTNGLLSLEELTDEQQSELKMQIQVSKLKNSPHGNQKITRKENAIKRKITNLENDISTWKTNMEFFTDSKNADQLKGDFQEKIEKAENELEELKKQLDVLNQV